MHIRKIEPLATHWRRFAWAGGVFDTALRPYTKAVEGTIQTPDHLILVTLRGGAERLEVTTDCGHRYSGPERTGAVSFVPAHCGRQLKLTGVRSAWASIALNPELLSPLGNNGIAFEFAPFSNAEDPILAGMVGEMERLHSADGILDPAYCESISYALAHYMARRYGRTIDAQDARDRRLPPWRLRRISEYVDAHIDQTILIRDLAALVGVSVGHLHRAFRSTTGRTPLDFVTDRRISKAVELLASEPVSIAELALRVGFLSPSHFTRTFRRIAGVNPSEFRPGANRTKPFR